MKAFLVRGVPNSVQMDGWWMSETPPPKHPKTRGSTQPMLPRVVALAALVIAGDALLWKAQPGISLALFGIAILLALWLLNGRKGTGALGFATLTFLPLVEYSQALSYGFFFVGLMLSVVWLALGGWPGLNRWFGALWRFVNSAPEVALSEVRNAAQTALSGAPQTSLKATSQSWLLPLGLGLVFASLLLSANPMLAGWFDSAVRVEWLSGELFYRGLFWFGLAITVLPILLSSNMQERLKLGSSGLPSLPVPAALNASSILRSLALFNLMFAAQTALDLTYLWGGASLPDGMSYAQYAHRGAYPLLATALLAGGFALAARPFTNTNPLLRVALLVWVAQNIFLVLSSLLRLELYVATYGLTHLRIAAFIWMVVVALGLALVVYQTLKDRPAAWLLSRTALLGVAALYAASFVSFSASIARFNLSQENVLDPAYVCSLSAHALPAITRYEAAQGHRLCYHLNRSQTLSADWREWGFRDWRLQRSLGKIATKAAGGTL